MAPIFNPYLGGYIGAGRGGGGISAYQQFAQTPIGQLTQRMGTSLLDMLEGNKPLPFLNQLGQFGIGPGAAPGTTPGTPGTLPGGVPGAPALPGPTGEVPQASSIQLDPSIFNPLMNTISSDARARNQAFMHQAPSYVAPGTGVQGGNFQDLMGQFGRSTDALAAREATGLGRDIAFTNLQTEQATRLANLDASIRAEIAKQQAAADIARAQITGQYGLQAAREGTFADILGSLLSGTTGLVNAYTNFAGPALAGGFGGRGR